MASGVPLTTLRNRMFFDVFKSKGKGVSQRFDVFVRYLWLSRVHPLKQTAGTQKLVVWVDVSPFPFRVFSGEPAVCFQGCFHRVAVAVFVAQENGDVLAWGSQSCGRLGLVEVKDRVNPTG